MNEHDLIELEKLLSAALSSNNEERNMAVKHCELQFQTNGEIFVYGLIELLYKSNKPQVRNIIAVYLRTQLKRGEPMLYNTLSEELQNRIKTSLLNRLSEEPLDFLRRQIGETTAELANITLYRNAWNELLPFLENCCKAQSASLRQVALTIFGRMAEDSTESLLPHVKSLQNIYANGLNDQILNVRLAAVSSLSLSIDKFNEYPNFDYVPLQKLIPNLMIIINDAISNNELEAVNEVVRSINLIALNTASILTPYMDHLTDMYVKLFQLPVDATISEDLKRLCIRFFVNCAVDCPPTLRRNQKALQSAIELSLHLLLEIELENNWGYARDSKMDIFETLNNNSLFDEAEWSLDRLAQSLGSKYVLPVIFPLIEEFMRNADWRYRVAGLHALAQIVEVMDFDDLPVIDVIQFVRDKHERVQYAALECLGMMAADQQPSYQYMYHQEHIEACLYAMSDQSCPRVQAHAVNSLYNFVEFEDEELKTLGEELIINYMDPVVSRLIELLNKGIMQLHEQCITTIAGIAGAIPNNFKKYYPYLMPILKSSLQIDINTNPGLRCRTIECISFIGMSVGHDVFAADAYEVLNGLVSSIKQMNTIKNDDITLQYTIQALSRLCPVLTEEFVTILPDIMPIIYRMASAKCNTTFSKKYDESSNEYRIKSEELTGSIEDKRNGIQMLSAMLTDLGESNLFPFEYLEQTASILLEACSFRLSEEIRRYSIESLPELIMVVLGFVRLNKLDLQSAYKLYSQIVEICVNRMQEEIDGTMLGTIVGSLRMCMLNAGELGKQSITKEQMKTIGIAFSRLISRTIGSIISKHQKYEREQKQLSKKELDEELDADTQPARELNYIVTDSMSTLIEKHGTDFLVAWNEMLPELDKLLKIDNVHAHVVVIFIFDDVVEHLKEHSVAYFPQFLPLLLNGASSQHIELQQASVYGLGVCAEFGGDSFKMFCTNALTCLLATIQHPNRDKNQYQTLTDTAMSAILKICLYQNDCIDVGKVIPLWLQCLPMRADEEEAQYVYTMICNLVEKSDPYILGSNYSNLSHLVGVLASSIGTPLIDEGTSHRILNLFSQIKKMPNNTYQHIINNQPVQLREKVHSIFSDIN